MSGLRAIAVLNLEPRSKNDAWLALASGSRSLMFQFPSVADESPNIVSLGAMFVTTDGSSLEWGDVDREVTLSFWSDEARIYVHPGSEFRLWYGMPVGAGKIKVVLGDLYDVTE